MKAKKVLAISLTAVLAVSIFAGCGSSSTATSGSNAQAPSGEDKKAAEASTDKKDVKKLDFMWFSDGKEGEVTQEIVNEYKEQNPNVEINMIEIPYNDYENKLRISISGGEPPALARVTYVGLFKDNEISLDDYLDPEAFKGQFSESLQPFYVYDGKVKGAPTDVTANGLIYNKTAFDKAGVKVPTSPDDIWTVEEWIEAMKEVMAKGDVKHGLVIDKTPHRLSTLLYGQGGSILSDDAKSGAMNSEAAIRTVDLVKRLHDEKICPPSVWVGSENPNDMFRTGQVAMHLAGSWMITNYRDNIKDFEWGVTYLPIGTTRSSVPGGKYIVAFDKTGVEKESVDFINYFVSKEANSKYCQESLFMSPRLDLADLEFSYGTEFYKIFANELEHSSVNAAIDWSHPNTSKVVKQPIFDGMAEVIQGKVSSKDMLENLNKIINDEINE